MSYKPWSKLKTQVMNLLCEDLKLDIHQAVYRMQSQRGSSDLPRYFITLNKEIIFDYPKNFLNKENPQYKVSTEVLYPHVTEMSVISDLLRSYINTPLEQVLKKDFQDSFGITDILKAADRRLGKEKLKAWAENKNEVVKKIIIART